MISLNLQIIRKDAKEQFVVLPYDEFLALQERLEDAADVLELRKAKQAEGDAPTVSFDEVKRKFAADGNEE